MQHGFNYCTCISQTFNEPCSWEVQTRLFATDKLIKCRSPSIPTTYLRMYRFHRFLIQWSLFSKETLSLHCCQASSLRWWASLALLSLADLHACWQELPPWTSWGLTYLHGYSHSFWRSSQQHETHINLDTFLWDSRSPTSLIGNM